MKRSVLPLFIGLLLFFPACTRHKSDSYIVVHVFRNRKGPAAKRLDLAILAIGRENLKTPEGNPILVATMELTSDADILARLGKNLRPEVLILDSKADWRPVDFGSLSPNSVCPQALSCVYGIPLWVKGEEREAAEGVLAALSNELARQD